MKYLLLLCALVFAGCVTTTRFRSDSVCVINSSSAFKMDKYIVTANHVVKEMNEVTVYDFYGKQFTGVVVARDTLNDIALISYPNAKFVDYSTSTVEIREKVYSVGNPMGLFFSEIEGMVQNVERTDDIRSYIQLGIDVGWGSSGSPVYDNKGRLVGVIVQAIPGTRFTFMVDIQNVVFLIKNQ